MSTLEIFQVALDIWLIALIGILAILTVSVIHRGWTILTRCWALFVFSGWLLFTDLANFVLDGTTTVPGTFTLWLGEVLMSIFQIGILWRFLVITDDIIYGDDREKKSWELRGSFYLALIDAILQLINPCLHFFWYYNEENHLTKGDYYMVSVIFPTVIIVFWFLKIYRGQKLLSYRMRTSYIAIFFLVLMGVIINSVFPSISSINVAIAISLGILFFSYRLDMLDLDEKEALEKLRNS